MTKMNAAVIERYKQPSPQIESVDVPEIGVNDVLVHVASASVNPIDSKVMNGDLKMMEKHQMPLTLGHDFSGVVVKVGSNVTTYQEGDKVYGRPRNSRMGTFADYLAVNQDDIAFKPANCNFDEAAAIPLVGLTSYQALHDVMNIQAGQKVLIQAASGGIGTIAIQIAKALGAFVATTTSGKNTEMVKKLGADQVIDYHKEQFQDVLSDYDFVFDTLGGKTLEESFKVLKPGGKIVSLSGMPNGEFAKENGLPILMRWMLQLASMKLTKLEKQTNTKYYFLSSKPSGQELTTLTHLIEKGAVHPVIDKTFSFKEIDQAFAYSQSGRAHGKIIIQINQL